MKLKSETARFLTPARDPIGESSLRILQITKYYYPSVSFGGPIQCTYNISRSMTRKGHEVTVFTTDAYDISSGMNLKDRFRLIDGTRVFFFHNVAKAFGFFISPKIVQALRKKANNFDVVHLHEYRTFQNLAFYYLRKKHTPYVLSLHGELEYEKEPLNVVFPRRLFDKVFGGALLKNASKIIALTEFEKAQLMRSGIKEEKIVVVPNAVNPEEFHEVPPKGYFRNLFDLKNEEIVLFLGRINNFKGLDTLVKAFSLLKGRENLKLVLAGPDDGMLESLRKLVASLQLKDRVLFTGSLNRRQVLAALNDAKVVVYASMQEGFPLVPLEAGMVGKPVIVSNYPSMAFVKKGDFGLTVKYGNAIQLKEALAKVLDSSVLSERLGQNGRRYILDNFTWDIVSAQIEAVYFEISQ